MVIIQLLLDSGADVNLRTGGENFAMRWKQHGVLDTKISCSSYWKQEQAGKFASGLHSSTAFNSFNVSGPSFPPMAEPPIFLLKRQQGRPDSRATDLGMRSERYIQNGIFGVWTLA